MKRSRCHRPCVRANWIGRAGGRASPSVHGVVWPRVARAGLALLAGAALLACSSSDQAQRPPANQGAGGSTGNDRDAALDAAQAGANVSNDATEGDASAAPDVSVGGDSGANTPDADASIDGDGAPGNDTGLVDVRIESPVDVRGGETASSDAPADTRADVPVDGIAPGPVDAPVDVPAVAQDGPVGGGCPLLVDDMESGVGHANDGCRNGFWFTYNDAADAGVQQPPAGSTFAPSSVDPPRGSSRFAAHTSGSGYGFAGLGLNFNSPPAGVTATYDASAYVGITFFAMGTGSIAVLFPDRDTDPTGLVCALADRGRCSDHFARQIVLSSTWQQYTVLFADLRQQGFGYLPPGGFDTTGVYGVLWQAMGPAAFDIWIDDLSFVAPGSGGTD